MAEHLFIRLDSQSTETGLCEWTVVDADGRVIAAPHRGPIEEITAEAAGRRSILLLPAVETITTQAELPTASQARMRQMVPFSLEDSLAEDVDKLMFGIGKRYDTGAVAVSVVARDKLDAWISFAEDAGISPSAVYAESDGVPDTPATLNIIVEDGTCYCRRPGQAAFALDGLPLDAAFAAVAATGEAEQEVQHAQLFLDEDANARWSEVITDIRESLSSLSVRIIENGALSGFAAKLVHEPGTNLLQGRYAPRSNWMAMLKPWRVAAMFFGAFLVVTLLSMTIEYMSLRSRDAQLSELVTERCIESYGTPRLSQCESAVGNELSAAGRGGSSGDSFLSMLSTMASVMEPDMQFQNMSYRDRALDLRVLADDVGSLDGFRQRMANTNRYEVRINNTTPEGDRYEGNLVIMEAGR